jgi:importin-7
VTKAWSKTNAEVYNTNPVPEQDKLAFRQQLVDLLTVASTTLRAQFTAILSKILISDYPEKWPEFQQLVLSYLHSANIAEVYTGLSLFLELTKIYRWKAGDSRLGLASVVTNIFPVALQIANKLLLDPSLEAVSMIVLILKSYKSAIAVLRLISVD